MLFANRRSFLAAVLATGSAGLSIRDLRAQSFPNRPIVLVVPFAAGGGTDAVARALGKGMADDLSTPVIIENRAGAGTILGSDAVARSAPDGHTLLVATIAHSVNPSLHQRLPYNTETAFAPVALIATSYNILVVRADSPLKSVNDVLAAAKASPGKLNYASPGVGTSAHLAGEMFQSFGKVQMTHVPYRGSGPALSDVLGGHVELMFATYASVASHIEAGKLRALAISAPAGGSTMTGVPTLAESGLPDFVLNNWYAIYAPAGTSPATVDRINASLRAATRDPLFVRMAQVEGLVISVGTPQELADFVKADIARWRDILAAGTIRPN
jgi:tripartite-type tricarboxylate transporter receptor subunit TctC